MMNMSETGSKDWDIAKSRFHMKLEEAERDISRFLKTSIISIQKLK